MQLSNVVVSSASISKALIEKAHLLPELSLPDQWYEVETSVRLPKRWEEIAKRMDPQGQSRQLAWDLAAKFFNQGKAFRAKNTQIAGQKCARCEKEIGLSHFVVVLPTSSEFISISGDIIHQIQDHGFELSPNLQYQLKVIVGSFKSSDPR